MVVDLLHNLTIEAMGYYHACHSPKTTETFDAWIARMITMLGPDNCKFLIRNRQTNLSGMWMTKGTYLYVPKISEAYRYSWGEAAVKCSNHKKLEAIRIINENEALDSKGHRYNMEPYNPILPPAYEDEDLDQSLDNQELEKTHREAIESAEGEGMPPMDNLGPGEIKAQHLIELDVESGHQINPYAPFYDSEF